MLRPGSSQAGWGFPHGVPVSQHVLPGVKMSAAGCSLPCGRSDPSHLPSPRPCARGERALTLTQRCPGHPRHSHCARVKNEASADVTIPPSPIRSLRRGRVFFLFLPPIPCCCFRRHYGK
ncbi:Hypothetical predicted protein [Pelobates cultripes]|uniref:Uncharacterized protein n=1 Tax=Pelobates cultripes TaxID=61616 RepID=A0AAD1W1D0_PELCU|nr:Hypothetical predicted protein [Pelobates cultripes]